MQDLHRVSLEKPPNLDLDLQWVTCQVTVLNPLWSWFRVYLKSFYELNGRSDKYPSYFIIIPGWCFTLQEWWWNTANFLVSWDRCRHSGSIIFTIFSPATVLSDEKRNPGHHNMRLWSHSCSYYIRSSKHLPRKGPPSVTYLWWLVGGMGLSKWCAFCDRRILNYVGLRVNEYTQGLTCSLPNGKK